MKELVLLLFRFLVGWLAIQASITLVFLLFLRSPQKNSLPDKELPKVAVILCLRGGDPFLPYCLRSLLQQNYPQYDLKLIVDSKEDPAWKIANDAIASLGATNVQVSPLSIRRYNCSLKCSSLVQAVSELDDSYKVVALADADAVVHPNWLRELVTPLNDPKVGATTGNRWYLPTGKYWGTTVRYLWNASAVVQMFFYGIPWGGTLAVKTEVIHQTGLLDRWARAYGEDTMIRRVLGQHGLKVKFVPSLLILNCEETDLPRLLEWMKRQLVSSRLYHPQWWAVIADAIQTVMLPNLLLVLFLVALCTQQWDAAILAISTFTGYIAALLLLAIALEKGVQQVISKHGEPTAKLSPTTVVKILLGILLTNWTHGFALLSSLWMSTVNWRGVIYRIKGPWNIKLIEYRPYQLLDQPVDSKVSL
ncbi:MAG: glycosyltransferase family 2 protein [Chlorogloeopsis fritschii C42_A2020_084]|uniref:glycosyltransferase n=1 Tax=Chlorogloeopsis fritschii TaxID=1124 RepID=UPI001A00BFAD|nr:glycosyltransferase family 2 protein [Chlorogloeopsis fritschii]MBF2009385.1 glycosyltransferase family 2 protein [Chlorogloeopsis fritschii C42_A2020_084]